MLDLDLEAIMPPAIRRLPRDPRGFPVPWFVADPLEGKPLDVRVADGRKRILAFKEDLCWVCGIPLGRNHVFLGGPLSVANRAFGDWACHEMCALFSARACPALNGSMSRRSGKEYPEPTQSTSGHILDLPPVVALFYAVGRIRFMEQTGLYRPTGCRLVRWFRDGKEIHREPALAILDAYLKPHGFSDADVRTVLAGAT